MSAYKQFLSTDLIITPFEVNKSFTFYGNEFTPALYDTAIYDVDFYETIGGNNNLLDRFLGVKGDFTTNQSTTGNDNAQYQVLIFDSIKELYYSNFQSSSYGSPVQTQSLYPGETEDGNVEVGNPDSSGRYENYLQSSNDSIRYFPTSSDSLISVISIPSRLYGDFIQPGSFELKYVDTNNKTYTFTDDKEGNLYYGQFYVGNIIYTHGIAVFTKLHDQDYPSPPDGYGTGSYGGNLYGGGLSFQDSVNLSNVTCSFSSSYTIYETQYKATIRENEFDFSLNPSLIKNNSTGSVLDFTTGSYFSPYITTVGLYDEQQNLLAVGKLAQPIPTSRTTDTTIFINIDR